MQKPPNFHSNSDTYQDLVKRMIQRMQQRQVDNQLLEICQQVFEQEFDQENLILSRMERVRLYRQVTKAVLTEMLAKINPQKR